MIFSIYLESVHVNIHCRLYVVVTSPVDYVVITVVVAVDIVVGAVAEHSCNLYCIEGEQATEMNPLVHKF